MLYSCKTARSVNQSALKAHLHPNTAALRLRFQRERVIHSTAFDESQIGCVVHSTHSTQQLFD